MAHKKTEEGYPIFRSYLEEENDKPYYSVNTLSFYYEDMERKQELIETLSKKIVEYDLTLTDNLETIQQEVEQRINAWDDQVEQLPETVNDLLTDWVTDGTIDTIIDDARLNLKADKVEMENRLAEKANIKIFDKMPTTSQLLPGEFGFVINTLRLIDVDFSSPNHLTDYFGTSKAGNTTIDVANDTLDIANSTVVTDAGIVFLKDKIPTDQRRKYTHKAKASTLSPSAYFLNLEVFISDPAVAVSSTITARTLFKVFQRTSGGMTIYRKRASGANEYWDGTTKTWTTVNSAISCAGTVNTYYQFELETNGNQVRVNIKSEDGNTILAQTPYMDWSLLIPVGQPGDVRMYWGDINTDAHYANITTDSFTIV